MAFAEAALGDTAAALPVKLHLVVLDDLGHEVARAQVIRNGHAYSQDAHATIGSQHLLRPTSVAATSISLEGQPATC